MPVIAAVMRYTAHLVRKMAFTTEPTGYHKTAVSDLQGAWSNLRAAVVSNFGFKDSDRLLFHIDEAMSWECVRNPNLMKQTFLRVKNIAAQSDAREEVVECDDAVRENIGEVFTAIAEDENLEVLCTATSHNQETLADAKMRRG